jgi:hypothetical protein
VQPAMKIDSLITQGKRIAAAVFNFFALKKFLLAKSTMLPTICRLSA